jgi:hypothetical protein
LIKEFWKYLAQIVTMIRWHVIHNISVPTSKVKVTCRGQRFTLSAIRYIMCPVYNFFIDQGILKILCTNNHNNKTICQAQNMGPYLPGHTWRSKINIVCCTFCVPSITSSWFKGFWKYLVQMVTIIKRCVMHNTCTPTSKAKVTLRGQSLTFIWFL